MVLGALIGAATTLTIIVAVLAIRGFSDPRERSEKDEAIDAATFLALRQLEQYVRSTRHSSDQPG
ncbi:MAG: hypothetical protein C5B48_12080 [Candidatus Rokuibacteriota bacterium]|nr:MAG: hypothetical protein C5B48_12080 [Candidatus Rokubacteria bacterium]